MKRDKTVCEAIKIVLKDKPEVMTSEQIYKEIIDNNLYKFKARNPQSVVVSTIRRSCVGVDNKSSILDKEFAIAREMDNDIYYILNDNSAYESQDNQRSYDSTNNNAETETGNTWLLTYNPAKWDWEDYDNAIKITRNGIGYYFDWNCSNQSAKVGDRVFIVKLGDKSTPKGIFATGYIVSDFYEGDNFDITKDNKIKYINIILTHVVDYRTDPIITLDEIEPVDTILTT